MTNTPEYKKLRESWDRLQKELQAFVDKGKSAGGDAGVKTPKNSRPLFLFLFS